MTVLVSLHDVAPPFTRQLHELWSLCLGLGVRPALLVVPNWHGRHPIAGDRRFLDWVHARVEQGARVFLHGERHDEVGSARALGDHWRAMGRTAREGEFLSLGYLEARARIERGLAALAHGGLVPIGFIPPAWLARAATRDAARDAGLALTEDDAHLYLLQERVTMAAPAVRWSARSPWRAHASALVPRRAGRCNARSRWSAWRCTRRTSTTR